MLKKKANSIKKIRFHTPQKSLSGGSKKESVMLPNLVDLLNTNGPTPFVAKIKVKFIFNFSGYSPPSFPKF